MSTIYALIVGINDYQNVGKLNGCVADADAVEGFLLRKYGEEKVKIVKLLNAQATRQNIIDAFTNHLGQAGDDDTAYFHYSGHGSREDAPEEFWAFFPEKKNETIVCYDSRDAGGYDLADKELAVLIQRVAKKDRHPHIVVSLDSCHSGGASRDDQAGKKRQTSHGGNKRSLDTYIEGYYKNQVDTVGKITVPNPCHIALSACASHEVAWEGTDHRGVFTKTLLEVLESEGIDKSYGKIFEKAQIKIRQSAGKQTPQVDAYQCESIWSEWLTGKELENTEESYEVHFDAQTNTWRIKAGALQGIMLAKGKQKMTLNIHQADFSAKIGQATVDKILLETAILSETPQTLEQHETYKATLSTLKNLSIGLYSNLSAEENEAAIPVGHYQMMDKPELADYQLEKEGYFINIIHRATNKIIERENADQTANLRKVLLKIARWENARNLVNEQTTLKVEKFEIMLKVDENKNGNFQNVSLPENNEAIFKIDYDTITKKASYLPYKILVTNQETRDLHMTLVAISPLYGIIKLAQVMIPKNTEKFELDLGTKGNMAFFKGQEDDLAMNMRLKFVVSTQNINIDLIQQENFSLNINKSQTRNETAKFVDDEELRLTTDFVTSDDWFTKDLDISLLRVSNQLSQDKNVDLGGIEILAHESITASVGIGNVESNTRGLQDTSAGVWKNWLQGQASMLAVGNPNTRNAGGQEIITLSNISGTISAENPLKIKLKQDLAAGEFIMPFALDGDMLVPIGFSNIENPNIVEIEDLPQSDTDTQSRSLGRALKFCLYKLSSKVLGIDDNAFFQLRGVVYTEGQEPQYKSDLPAITEQVQKSNKILLLVHGIIGSTSDMAAFAKTLVDNKTYDLILAFDYENLNTPIESIAYELKTRLEAVGISAGKKIDILAHSMGGLVSRWFIEHRQGSQMVNRLIMCGTPNGGSNFGKIEYIRKIASIAALLGANLLTPFSAISWAVNIFKGIKATTGTSQIVLKTLAQMDKNSDFLRDLNQEGKASGIPYHILAGNVQDYAPTDQGFWNKIKNKILGGVGNLVNWGDANDIAVLTEDIKKAGKNTAVQTFDIPCHHLNYFTQEDSVQKLVEILQK